MQSTDRNLFSLINRETWIWLALGIVSLAVFACYYVSSSPWASLDLKLTREDVTSRAKEVALDVGLSNVTKTMTYFYADKDAKSFLEYELGTQRANQLMKEKVPVWKWVVKVYESKDGDPIQIETGPAGQFYSLSWTPEKSKKGRSLPHAEAKEKLQAFISRVLSVDVMSWKLITDKSTLVEGSRTHTFTWEDKDSEFAGGSLRIDASMSGSTVNSVRKYLHIPDSFSQKFRNLRAENEAYANVAQFLAFCLWALIPLAFCWFISRKQIRPRLAFAIGIATAAFCFISEMNDMLTRINLHTGLDIKDFTDTAITVGVIRSAVIGFLIAIAFSTVEVLYRKAFPKHMALENILNGSAWNSKSFLNACLIGVALFGFHSIYSLAFYYFGQRLGVYVPLSFNEPYVLSSFCPIWDSIHIGIRASTLEELLDRVYVLILFQQKLAFGLANFIQASLWGFAHCNYAVEPPYIRGVELTICGLFYGYVLKRFGILPVVIAHYAFDVCVTSITLYCSKNPFDPVMALLGLSPIVILPLVSILRIRRVGLANEDSFTNESVQTPPVDETLDKETAEFTLYMPFSRKVNLLLLAAGIIALAICFIPVDNIGKIPFFKTNRSKAEAIARDYFNDKHPEVEAMESAATIGYDTRSHELRYLYRKVGLKKARELSEVLEPRFYWKVKLFRPGESNHYQLNVAPDGKPLKPMLRVDEKTHGARLTKADALSDGRRFISKHLQKPVKDIAVTGVNRQVYEDRTDYSMTVEVEDLKVENAPFEASLSLIGDEPSDLTYEWKVPDKPEEANKNIKQFFSLANACILMVLLVIFGYWTVKNYKLKRINWIIVIPAIAAMVMLEVLDQLNKSVVTALGGDTSEALISYYASYLSSALWSIVLYATAIGFLLIAVAAVKSEFFSRKAQSSVVPLLEQLFAQTRFWRYGVILGYLAAVAWMAIEQLRLFCYCAVKSRVTLNFPLYVSSMDYFSPSVHLCLVGLIEGVKYTLLTILVVQWAKSQKRGFIKIGVLAAFYIAFSVSNPNQYSNTEFGIEFLAALASVTVYLILMVKVGRMNWSGCFFAVFANVILQGLIGMFSYGREIYPADVIILSLLFVAPLLFLLVISREDLENAMRGNKLETEAGNDGGNP